MNGTHTPASPAWLPVIASLAAVAAVEAGRFHIVPVNSLTAALITIVAVPIAILATLVQSANQGGEGPWMRVFVFRVTTFMFVGVWASWALTATKAGQPIVVFVIGAVALAGVGHFCRTPVMPAPRAAIPAQMQPIGGDRRHEVIRKWEPILRSVSKLPVKVTDWKPWEQKDDGFRLFVELPADSGTTTADLAMFAGKFAAAARLPHGCAVRILDSDRQGLVVVDVMTRNSLTDVHPAYIEPTTAASINDDFPVLTTPRGELLSICLRVFSMVVGGTTGSGKTTLLHRIIMWLARCTDALIWVVDLNGGGVAEPWVSPFATGRAVAPVVDWIADSEEEAAAMVAVAGAIARDRKTNREATRRKRDGNTMVLPVDRSMPAIVVLTDEGGEVRQATSLLGQLAGSGITRLAQIGRAEGVRVIMSVLRGTSDLTDKGLRVNAALRLCLRMEEHDEYVHVLGTDPGKTELGGALGAGYLRTPAIPRPVLGSTVNVDLAGIDRHAVACGPLRPELDEWGMRAAERVTPSAILGNRIPTEEQMFIRVLQDAADGRAYTGRWDRYAAKLAEMRGDELPPEPEPLAVRTAASSRTAALDSWASEVQGPTEEPADAQVYRFPVRTQKPTAREQIVSLVRAAGPDGVSAAELEREVDAVRSRFFEVLRQLREEGVVATREDGLYVLAVQVQPV